MRDEAHPDYGDLSRGKLVAIWVKDQMLPGWPKEPSLEGRFLIVFDFIPPRRNEVKYNRSFYSGQRPIVTGTQTDSDDPDAPLGAVPAPLGCQDRLMGLGTD
eukprot:gene18460-biopygen5432